uniref:Type I cytokine receptor cytokine-binding domain-containing protein n=1 Tax=Spermophilus dauricus TaxID=99837 RepID=A0A8C9P442_SPEDA
MAFICLDLRCLFIVLICTEFSSTFSSSTEIKVNPPQDFVIVDPGYLGHLYLQWQPPLALENFKECTIEYELQYRNINSERWKVSKACTYNIRVIIRYLLVILLTTFIHFLGSLETKIQDMVCVYYNWQYLICSWKPGVGAHLDTNYTLFYWYEGLEHTSQCVDYIKSNGVNVGCTFPSLESSDYKDFFVCVNGSSESKPIRSSYFIFQLQNIVKPLPPDYLNLTVKNIFEINLKWSTPKGPIPAKCFIYEVVLTGDETSWMVRTLNLFRKVKT